jgi:hypothetical protein
MGAFAAGGAAIAGATSGLVSAGVATTALTSLAVGAGGLLLSSALAGKSAAPAIPTAPVPATAPVIDQGAVNAATQQQTALAQATSGRMSTVLSQSSGSDKLG